MRSVFAIRLSVLLIAALSAAAPCTRAQRELWRTPPAPALEPPTAIASAGDVDRDGAADFWITSANAGFGMASLHSGRSGRLLRVVRGSRANQRFGVSIADAHDVDKDGYPDVIIGVATRNPAETAGEAVVISGRDGRTLRVYRGVPSRTHAVSVDWAGDIDRDGFADVVIGSPERAGQSVYGQVEIRSGRTGLRISTLYGARVGQRFGMRVRGAGDLDGDGTDDVLIGSMDGIHIYSGGSRRIAKILRNAAGQSLGRAFDRLGDINKDGFADFVIGIEDARRVDVWGGNASMNVRLLRSRFEPSALTKFGAAVAGLGDFDGDGYADYAVTEPWFSSSANDRVGRVHVLSGRSGSLLHQFVGTQSERIGLFLAGSADTDCDTAHGIAFEGRDLLLRVSIRIHAGLPQPAGLVAFAYPGAGVERPGSEIATIGDIDRDGVDDFVVNVLNPAVPGLVGKVQVVSGRTRNLIRTHVGRTTNGLLGWSVTALGDIDGDRVPDYAAGAPGFALGRSVLGSVTVYSGASGRELLVARGQALDDRFGKVATAAGDVDRDGRGDLLVAAESYVELISGRSGIVLRHFNAPVITSVESLAGGRDFDGDRVPDVVIGAPHPSGSQLRGMVFVISSLTGAFVRTLRGARDYERFGSAVAALDDLDGDGTPDLAIGSPFRRLDGPATGVVTIFSGATGRSLRVLHSAEGEGRFGQRLVDAGDLDGDGRSDLFAAAPGASCGGHAIAFEPRSGRRLFAFAGARFGDASVEGIASGGDLDGDGAPDLIVSGGGVLRGITIVR
ncbi:MAG: FG-GAP repeat protein [Planctomycetes bacterium]|nr:FG-GAP repeat protein [Planctomycetota bacterium]